MPKKREIITPQVESLFEEALANKNVSVLKDLADLAFRHAVEAGESEVGHKSMNFFNSIEHGIVELTSENT